jgi:hypothetical protein
MPSEILLKRRHVKANSRCSSGEQTICERRVRGEERSVHLPEHTLAARDFGGFGGSLCMGMYRGNRMWSRFGNTGTANVALQCVAFIEVEVSYRSVRRTRPSHRDDLIALRIDRNQKRRY